MMARLQTLLGTQADTAPSGEAVLGSQEQPSYVIGAQFGRESRPVPTSSD